LISLGGEYRSRTDDLLHAMNTFDSFDYLFYKNK
jgi:hypothetical protein